MASKHDDDNRSNQLLSQISGFASKFSPDGETLIATVIPSSRKENYVLYNFKNLRLNSISGSYAVFQPSGKMFITYPDLLKSGIPGYLYDLSGKLIAKIDGAYPDFSPDGQYLSIEKWGRGAETRDNDKTYLYDLKKLNNVIPVELTGVIQRAFSPNSRYLALEGGSYSWKEGKTYSRIYEISTRQSQDYYGSFLGFSHDNRYIATSAKEGKEKYICLYDIFDKENRCRKFEGVSAYFTTGLNYLITSSEDEKKDYVCAYDLSISTPNCTKLRGKYSFVSPNNLLITRVGEDELYVYNLEALSSEPSIHKSIKNFYGVNSISKDGTRIISGTGGDIGSNRLISIYNLANRNLLQVKGVDAKFNADGKYVVVTTLSDSSGRLDDGVSRLYDNTESLVQEFPGSHAIFSPDGKQVFVSSTTGTRVYDLQGQLLNVFPGIHPVLSQNQQFLITFSSEGGTGRLWQMDNGLDDLIERGCTWLDSYFVNNPEAFDRLKVCQTQLRLSTLAPKLIAHGEQLLEVGEIKKAIAKYRFVEEMQSTVEVAAESWNKICWIGSIEGHAKDVLFACEKAVRLAHTQGNWRDSRGLARALTGNTKGAVDDFQLFLKWLNTSDYSNSDKDLRREQRQGWIRELLAGKPPSKIFTKEVLEQLRNQ